MDNNSQNEMIRKYLENGNTITPLEALKRFNCFRLGARIHNLKAMGLAIHSRLVNSDGKRFSEYSLEPSEDHARDRYAVADRITESMR